MISPDAQQILADRIADVHPLFFPQGKNIYRGAEVIQGGEVARLSLFVRLTGTEIQQLYNDGQIRWMRLRCLLRFDPSYDDASENADVITRLLYDSLHRTSWDGVIDCVVEGSPALLTDAYRTLDVNLLIDTPEA